MNLASILKPFIGNVLPLIAFLIRNRSILFEEMPVSVKVRLNRNTQHIA
jgi:hypothetical protein